MNRPLQAHDHNNQPRSNHPLPPHSPPPHHPYPTPNALDKSGLVSKCTYQNYEKVQIRLLLSNYKFSTSAHEQNFIQLLREERANAIFAR